MAGRRFNKEKLFRMRELRGWSHQTAGEMCSGNSYQDFSRTLLRLENSDVLPRRSTLEKLCRGFGISSVDEWILEPGEMPDWEDMDYYNRKKGLAQPAPPGIQKAEGRFLLAMDVDNTILRGFEFSWQEIWRYLGYDDETRRRKMRKFLKEDLSYEAWCVYCMTMYANKGLTRSDFDIMTRDFYVVANLRHGIELLKQNGGIIAVISGGVDTFLEAMIPDYRRLFDEVFINRLHFRSSGKLFDVTPTPYDFAGKADAVRLLQERYQIPTSDTYFVGEGLNDQYVINAVGTSIAWNPADQVVENGFDVVVRGADFMDIVRKILPAEKLSA